MVPFCDLDPLRIPDARRRIRTAHAQAGRRFAVLDDDPTGSQAVHGVTVLTVPDPAEYPAALRRPGDVCFVLTNSRSLPEPAAARLVGDVARDLYRGQALAGERSRAPLELVSRSDSTLRGHVLAEVEAVRTARRETLGRDVDGVLFVPAYFEAGRFTADDVHWARVAGRPVPVGETEFARDPAFGYRASDLREFLVEVGRGSITADRVLSVGLPDIRLGGPAGVARILSGARDGAFVVVNALEYSDLEVVVLGLLQAQAEGRTFLHRTGPSFVRALAGLEPKAPLTAAETVGPAPGSYGSGSSGPRGPHGLLVVGSHVGLTGRQLAVARERGGLVQVEVEVPSPVDPGGRARQVERLTAEVLAGLEVADVLLCTGRTLVTGADAGESLEIARQVSTTVSAVVRGALAGRPAWVVAKGGITSHDVAVHGLGIRRARVLGQLLPGMVSVFRPERAHPAAMGIPYVVFAGNVGDDDTLATVLDLVRAGTLPLS